MNVDRVQCRNCGRTMSRGFIVDKGEQNRPGVARWVEGLPEKSFWTGLKLKGRRQVPVTVLRCERCGLLESYALPQE